jgi:hypothetical protein
MLNFFGLLGLKSAHTHVFVGLCHDIEEPWELMGSLDEATIRIAGNN